MYISLSVQKISNLLTLLQIILIIKTKYDALVKGFAKKSKKNYVTKLK